MSELPEERWTIQVCEDHRALDCAHCGVFDVIAVVAASRLEAAEGERDAAREDKRFLAGCLEEANEAAERLRGERDRLREAGQAHERATWAFICEVERRREWCVPATEYSQMRQTRADLRAGLSTGDRQEQHLGGTGEAVPQTLRDGHKSEGGST